MLNLEVKGGGASKDYRRSLARSMEEKKAKGSL